MSAIIVCLLLVPTVHPVGPLLRAPYWLDEAWVALSAKASPAELRLTTASTPIGWTFLVWLLPANSQVHRLIPYAFLAASVACGYGFARVLGWADRGRAVLAGAAGAGAALLLPAQQARHDLKQYTADAAIALLLLILLAWAESAWSRRRAVAIGAAIVGGMLFSHTAALVGGAVLGGLLVSAVVTRRWSRLPGLLLFTGATVAGMALVYLSADRTGSTSSLSAYWADYLPSPDALPGYLATRLGQLRPAVGLPWALLILFAVVGVFTVVRLHRPATAAAVVLLPAVAVAAGIGHIYPLLDQRTSHFLLVSGAVVAAVGLAGTAMAVAAVLPGLSKRVEVAVGAGLVAVALAGFAYANRDSLRSGAPPDAVQEDVRAQVAYVAAHRGPGDVVLVNLSGQYGFAYYWSGDQPRFVHGGVAAIGWYVEYPSASRIVVAGDRDSRSVASAVRRAEQMAGAGGRIWLVRTHVNASESRAWQDALAGRRVPLVAVGPEPVALVTPG